MTSAPLSHESPKLRDMRIFIVEDSFESMALMKNMMNDMGINQVYTAKNGREALEFLDTCDDMIDIIVCDWNMPRITGIDLLKQIRTVDPDMPFLMVTGAADLASVAEAKASGVSAYIKKPFSSDQLRKKLEIMARVVLHRRKRKDEMAV